MEFVIILAIAAGLAFIPANIAKKKGYSFGLWWFYGWMLWIVAIIHVNLIPDKNAPQAQVQQNNVNLNSKTYGCIAAVFCFLAAIQFVGVEYFGDVHFLGTEAMSGESYKFFLVCMMLFYVITLCKKKIGIIIFPTLISTLESINTLICQYGSYSSYSERYYRSSYCDLFSSPAELFYMIKVLAGVLLILLIVSTLTNNVMGFRNVFIPGMFYLTATLIQNYGDHKEVVANLFIAVAYFAIGMMCNSMIREESSGVNDNTTNCNAEARKINVINTAKECESVKN